ncbi:hypothetical protein ASD19_09495 [Microbacterium sp. Root53]|jgi:hypothetical protein|nr:hypothetical protein ASD19_09495 [Microbacterium sp. Root53]
MTGMPEADDGTARGEAHPRRAALIRLAAAVAIGAAIGVGLFVWAGSPGGGDDRPAVEGTGGDATRTEAPADEGRPADEAPDDDADGPSPDDGSADGGDPGDSDRDEPGANSPGIEMAPEPDPSASPPGSVGELPPRPDLEIPAGPDAPVSEVDGLVDGFPVEVIAVARTATVLSSSVSSDGSRLHASVEATDSRSVAEVMDGYTGLLGELGFTWTTIGATDGGTAISFTREGHVVVVSARPEAEGSLFTVLGILDEAG